jgi:hypothetical protein
MPKNQIIVANYRASDNASFREHQAAIIAALLEHNNMRICQGSYGKAQFKNIRNSCFCSRMGKASPMRLIPLSQGDLNMASCEG